MRSLFPAYRRLASLHTIEAERGSSPSVRRPRTDIASGSGNGHPPSVPHTPTYASLPARRGRGLRSKSFNVLVLLGGVDSLMLVAFEHIHPSQFPVVPFPDAVSTILRYPNDIPTIQEIVGSSV